MKFYNIIDFRGTVHLYVRISLGIIISQLDYHLGTIGIVDEQVHIKDGIARLTVEIIKREWPQLWTSLLKDLYDLCQMGVMLSMILCNYSLSGRPVGRSQSVSQSVSQSIDQSRTSEDDFYFQETQTEIVLKIFLRLIEDVITFQNVPLQRRREIMQSLTSHMGELFEFFMNLLQNHTSAANSLTSDDTLESKVAYKAHTCVSEAVLTTMTGYLDWVTMNHIFMKDGLLLRMLCLLLNNRSLQLPAVDCLLIIVSKKGKIEDRKPLLILFSEDAMAVIWNAIVTAEQVSLDEYYYLFLKRLCQGVVTDMISSYTQTLWATFLRHDIISKEPDLIACIPKLFHSATKTLLKVGFPTQNNSLSCNYARLDFDSDEEFNMFFSKYRAEVADTLRLGTVIQPVESFMFARDWLQNTLQKPLNTGNGAENGNCKLTSPSFLEWDAMTVCLECVMARAMQSSGPLPDLKDGITLLQNVLSFQTEDPLILSSLLSCLSALFPFLNHVPEILPSVIEKIFSAVTFNILGQTKSTRSRAVKNARQHACSILVKICKQYQELLFPVFDKLYSHIKIISSNDGQLSQMEKCILIEALIIVSVFIEEVMKPVKDLWLSSEFKIAFSAADKLMSYIGLDQAPVEPSSADTCGINRSHISYCITMILGVLKRSKWPEDLQMASKGGFVLGNINGTSVMYRNPATAHVKVLMENLMLLMKSMNAAWDPSYLNLRHPDFAKSYELVDNEKQTILGIPYPCVDNSSSPTCKNPLDRMKNFLTTTHDNSCHILGNAGQCLGYEFYTEPNLAESILNTVLTNLQHLPDYRMKPLINILILIYFDRTLYICHSDKTLYICHSDKTLYIRHSDRTLYICHSDKTLYICHSDKTLYICHSDKTLYIRHSDKTLYIRHSDKTLYICHSDKTLYICHSDKTLYIRHSDKTLYIRHSDKTLYIRHSDKTLYIRHSDKTLYIRHSDKTLSILNCNIVNDRIYFLVKNTFNENLKVFIKPYILSCPKECFTSAVIPLLAFLCPFMYERLGSKWQIINQRSVSETDDLETQEILEEQLTRQLTREYIDLLGCICRNRKIDISTNTEDEMIDDNDILVQSQQLKDDSLGDLGQLCLKEELVADKKMTSNSAVHFLCCVLFGLQQHGEHEGCQASLLSLGLQTYELLRPLFPDISSVLLQIPNCTVELVKAFDDKILLSSPQKQMTDKKKKDAFKKLVVGVIGQNIGQKFKREIHYKNLPPLYRLRPKVPTVDDTESEDIGLCGLFKPSNTDS
ncbi:LOW QUALITY PROTEIN: hypothetical protein KUTeg_014259 [Tegillarca granosa]|uniref:Exportin-5 n=1 Tax=Tegillarca granosa TaxID=220873 RepID=A0ABQ9EZU0_TEGGR|nr:LOW QUALITY PROTEIN: hypothetical protein KUTeg_014259 [Tegillarca granosa]